MKFACLIISLALVVWCAAQSITSSGGGGGTGDFKKDGSIPMTGALTFTGTTHAGIRLNNLTTVQRDAITPLAGYTIWNTTTGQVESYSGSAWGGISGGGVSVATLTDAATVTINVSGYSWGNLATLSQTTNFAAPTGTPTDGQKYTISITSSTARTITFDAAFDDSDDMPFPTVTSGSSKTDLLHFVYVPTKAKWCLAGKNFGF